MNAVQFIEENQAMFFHWLFKTAPRDFPRVCEYAADVMGSWIYHQFPDEQIEVQSGLYDGWSHAWIEVNGQIIDLTITQFLGGMNQDEVEGLSDEEFYNRYFLAYQSSPVIKGQLADHYQVEEGLVLCQYDQAKWHQNQQLSFEVYLQEIYNQRIREWMYEILKEQRTMSMVDLQRKMDFSSDNPLFVNNLEKLVELGTFVLSQERLVFNGYVATR